jgi:sensor histidine kinase YesM
MRVTSRAARVLGLLAGALALATLTSLHLYLNWRLYGEVASYPAIWFGEAFEWTAWAALVPVIWTIERRYGSASGRPVRAVFVHAGALLVLYFVLNLIMTLVSLALGVAATPDGLGQLLLLRAINNAPSAVLVYSLIVAAAVIARVAASHSRQRAALEAQLAEARLRYLRAQIQPHFLFNTLHGIAGLVREEERDQAVKIIGLLGTLLRRALSTEDGEEIELGEELEDLETYVEIQRMRFGDRLDITSDVPATLRSVHVPGLMLQPLVENAIRHGLGPDGGHIHISAARENGAVVIQVLDDGVGLASPYEEGIGLGNLRARLHAMYGPDAQLQLHSRPASGTAVRVRIPVEAAPAANE